MPLNRQAKMYANEDRRSRSGLSNSSSGTGGLTSAAGRVRECGDPVGEGGADRVGRVFGQEVQPGTLISRWWGQVRAVWRSAPVSSAPGSPLMKSFGTGVVAIQSRLATTMSWTSLATPSGAPARRRRKITRPAVADAAARAFAGADGGCAAAETSIVPLSNVALSRHDPAPAGRRQG